MISRNPEKQAKNVQYSGPSNQEQKTILDVRKDLTFHQLQINRTDLEDEQNFCYSSTPNCINISTPTNNLLMSCHLLKDVTKNNKNNSMHSKLLEVSSFNELRYLGPYFKTANWSPSKIQEINHFKYLFFFVEKEVTKVVDEGFWA